MALVKTKIQWSDYTVNPWFGCRKCSAGCKFCYMFRLLDGDNPTLVREEPSAKWKLKKCPAGSKVFIGSMTDFFIEEGDQWRPLWWKYFREREDLHLQLLTKRIGRVAECLPEDWGEGYKQVWLGVSIENQKVADRVIELVKFKGKNKIWLSLEPLIGPIDFLSDPNLKEAFRKVDWVVIGGESGNQWGRHRYRECRLTWIYNLMMQCDIFGIPVFFKQLGSYLGNYLDNREYHGGNQERFPKGLQRFEFPEGVKPFLT